jgi:teichuronic acid exporter
MSLRKQAKSGMVWTFAEQFGNQIIGFVVSLILARILMPSEFGLIGMIAILVGLGRVLVDSGLTQSLIRNQDCDQEDYSTVFYFNLASSILIYAIIYSIAPFVADFYNQPILVDIIRLYCLTFIFSAFSAVQLARLTKKMDFKIQTLITLPANLIGGIAGIILAYKGFGVFSLVWSQVLISAISTIQLWFYSKWKPDLAFNFDKFRDHFNYGYKLALSGIIDVLFKNAYILVIGKFFSASEVGFYTRAESMKNLPVRNISAALKKVTFPLFSSIQEDNIRLKRVYKQLMQMVVFVLAPVLVFVAVLAEPTFRLLFTEKWLPAVPYFQILCVTGILGPIHTYNLNVLKVKGRSDLYLKVKVFQKIIIVFSILSGLQFGIYGLLYAQVLVSLITFFLNAYFTNRFINFSAWEQMKAILPTIFISSICGAVILGLDHLINDHHDVVRIIAGGLAGLLLYMLISWSVNLKSFTYFRNLVLKRK